MGHTYQANNKNNKTANSRTFGGAFSVERVYIFCSKKLSKEYILTEVYIIIIWFKQFYRLFYWQMYKEKVIFTTENIFITI